MYTLASTGEAQIDTEFLSHTSENKRGDEYRSQSISSHALIEPSPDNGKILQDASFIRDQIQNTAAVVSQNVPSSRGDEEMDLDCTSSSITHHGTTLQDSQNKMVVNDRLERQPSSFRVSQTENDPYYSQDMRMKGLLTQMVSEATSIQSRRCLRSLQLVATSC